MGSAVIGLVQVVFTLALLPTVFDSRAQVPRPTSSITAGGLWIITSVYLALGLHSAAVAAAAAAAAWTFVFIFRPMRAT
jgi:uncharacterized membrane protein